jgi:hypothetical protein
LSSGTTAEARAVTDPPASQRDWRTSAERVSQRARYLTMSLSGIVLAYSAIGYFFVGQNYFETLGLSKRAGTLIAGSIFLVGVILFLVAVISQSTARDRFYAVQERATLKAVDEALGEVSGPDDLMGLMRANRKQMDAYDALARSQAQTSYRASQIAMGIGLAILTAGIVIAIFAHSDATKYAAAIITASGAAVGGFITRTFISVHLHASNQMNFYFRQPLVQSYLLSAERLAQRLPEKDQPEQINKILASVMAQVDPSRAEEAFASSRPRRRWPRNVVPSSNTEEAHSDDA